MSSIATQYLQWYFESNIWKNVSYCGVRTLKFPPDMWNYQEIISEYDVQWIVETGTRHGGSALFFADLLRARNASGKVISVDITAQDVSPKLAQHEKITMLVGDSGASEMAQKVAALLPQERGRVFMILDADHTAQHVRRELDVLVPLLKSGDYLIVEDTIVNGHPVRPEFGPGPWEAAQDYIKDNPQTLQPDAARAEKFGSSFAWQGYYIKL